MLVVRKNPMLNIRKFVSLVTVSLCLSTPLFGMMEDIKKVASMTDLHEIDKLLKNNDFPSGVAIAVLNELRKDPVSPIEKVKLLVKHADPQDLAHSLSLSSDYEDSYVTQKMKKKAYGTSQSNMAEDVLPKKTRSKKLFGNLRARVQKGKKKDKKAAAGNADTNLLHQEQVTEESSNTVIKKLLEDVNDIVTDSPRKSLKKEKNKSSFFSYVKWAALCGVSTYVIYYLYKHKYKPVAHTTRR
jgi:hypothetical protein